MWNDSIRKKSLKKIRTDMGIDLENMEVKPGCGTKKIPTGTKLVFHCYRANHSNLVTSNNTHLLPQLSRSEGQAVTTAEGLTRPKPKCAPSQALIWRPCGETASVLSGHWQDTVPGERRTRVPVSVVGYWPEVTHSSWSLLQGLCTWPSPSLRSAMTLWIFYGLRITDSPLCYHPEEIPCF